MKIRHMIVTHKEPELLHKQLCSIYNNGKISHDYHLCILNNHPYFKIDDQFSNVQVIHNQTRHPNSNGHLARDWNTGLILGFEDLKNPACDIVILSQNDVVFDEFFLDKIVEIHKTWEFCTYGKGDEAMSFSPEHIRKVGLFSEHYALCGLQEGDFWLRSKRKNPTKSSINDEFHKQTHNPIDHKVTMFSLCGMERRQEFDKTKDPYVKIASNFYNQKWQNKHHWIDSDNEDGGKFLPKQHMFYPWFEKDIDQRNYINPFPMKKPIHCVGNSHANTLTNTELSHIGKSPQVGPFISYSIGAGLAWKFTEKHLSTVQGLGIPIGDPLLLMIGEVDIRVHIIKQSEIQNRPVADIVYETVDRFFESVKILNRDYQVICYSNQPTTSKERSEPDSPVYGAANKRNYASYLWDSYLGELCAAENIPYVSVLSEMMDDFVTDETKFVDYCHVRPDFLIPLVTKKLEDLAILTN